jgi:hypothetical protein
MADSRCEIPSCARDFAHMFGPRESLYGPELAESGETHPGAIYLGPRIIALNSPALPRRTDPQIIAMYSLRSAIDALPVGKWRVDN